MPRDRCRAGGLHARSTGPADPCAGRRRAVPRSAAGAGAASRRARRPRRLSPDHYSRVEQGRQSNVSSEVLDALARALRLDETEHAHLRDLAAPAPRSTTTDPPQRPDPGLLRVMDTLDHVPVLVLGHRGDVRARNALLREVLGRPLEPGSSFARFLFLEPAARERIVLGRLRPGHGRRAAARIRPPAARRPPLDADRRAAHRRPRRRALVGRSRRTRLRLRRQAHPAPRGWRPVVRHRERVGAAGARPAPRRLHDRPDSPTARVLPILASWSDEVPSGAHHAESRMTDSWTAGSERAAS